jgi:sulfite reductase alpha subunit
VSELVTVDMAAIGTWRDDIRIDQAAVQGYIKGEYAPNAGAHSGRDWGKFDIKAEVLDLCPTDCMSMEGGKLVIDNAECTRCMHCLNVMPRALRPGLDKGASILFGAKAPILEGAQMATLVIPFIKMDATDDFAEYKALLEKAWDWWMENGKNRERIGESAQRIGLANFLKVMEVAPIPQHIREPRSNPYVFWKDEEVEGGFERSLSEFRKKHPM